MLLVAKVRIWFHPSPQTLSHQSMLRTKDCQKIMEVDPEWYYIAQANFLACWVRTLVSKWLAPLCCWITMSGRWLQSAWATIHLRQRPAPFRSHTCSLFSFHLSHFPLHDNLCLAIIEGCVPLVHMTPQSGHPAFGICLGVPLGCLFRFLGS